jgi:hypothetical protein
MAASFDGGLPPGVFSVFTLPAELLRPGTNLLAVEVHQRGSISSDIVFGMAMMLALPDAGPAAIRREPVSLVAVEGDAVTLDAAVAGTQPLTLQWFRNGVAVPGVTNLFLTFSNASRGDRGL